MQVAFPFQEGMPSQKRSVTRNCHQKRVQMYNKSITRLKTVWNFSSLLYRVLICFEEARNQARSFHAAIETITRIRPFHHYYTYGAARAISNPGTPSIVAMAQAYCACAMSTWTTYRYVTYIHRYSEFAICYSCIWGLFRLAPNNQSSKSTYPARALHLHYCVTWTYHGMLSTTFTYTYEASAHEQKYLHNAQWAPSMGVAMIAN